MRIKIAAVLFLVAGAALAAYLLLGNRTLTPLQLDQARTECPQCGK